MVGISQQRWEQDGNGGDDGRDDKKKFRYTKYDFEDKGEEESDTEDSYELEISPKQLNQVAPGGGVLKIKLSKKKRIKITAGAPDGEPDLAQTKLKTVYGPISKKGGQLPLGESSNVLIETEQPREKGIPPVRASQPTLGIGHILLKRVSEPNANENGDPDGDGSFHGHGGSSHGNSGSNGGGGSPDNGNPQRKGYSQRRGGGSNGDGESNGNGDPPDRRKEPPRGNGNPDGGDGASDPDDSGDGDDSSSSSDSTLPRRRGHRKPKYVYVLQGPPGPPGQEGQPGQPGQAERDGRDGHTLPLTGALEETLRVQRTNLDSTGLENSFSQFGRTMSEVLKAQQRANQNLEEQFKRTNETQEFQTEAIQDMTQANF